MRHEIIFWSGRSTLVMKRLWGEPESVPKFQRGWNVNEETLEEGKGIQSRDRW
ncbi:hypothetical protein HOY82DRAFT_386872 [Tuber indicum]|nr:hypothetical protein HOY82DRAFT_386872 [Tuber indicum]